ncbi:MAG: NTP transferase domain-containing protein [Eubacteriales bacterium]|nr:NTP transferase domain-containing protein [Eubacteriales bacterium]
MNILKKFTSKRNDVFLAEDENGRFVIKRYARAGNAAAEKAVYDLLSGGKVRIPKILSSGEHELKLEYVDGVTFTELLDSQERTKSVDFAPWETLVKWLCLFNKETGLAPGDCNLRNFILDAQGQVCGIDFEQCGESGILEAASAVCAFVELYNPQETPLKMSVSHFLQEKFSEIAGISAQELAEQTACQKSAIISRRERKKYDAAFSAVILAGGKSSRMGSCKAELPWGGKTLVEHQADRIMALGITDIMVSGYSRPVTGTRYVPDLYPEKGPLGGIHACLCAAKSAACFVISVDAPLFSPDGMKMLIEAHLAGDSSITVAGHCGTLEPLIGVYDSSLSDAAEKILQGANTSVKRLLDQTGFAVCEFSDENSVRNCNTPDEYNKLYAETKEQHKIDNK